MLSTSLAGKYNNASVLILIPDHTRTIPLDMLFPIMVEILDGTKQLDFMVALGTHPPLSSSQLCDLVGITSLEKESRYQHINLLNHEWDNPTALADIGILTQAQIQEIAGDYWHYSLGGDVPIRINKHIFEYDEIIILGPTFPHEVVGFSGGAKYLFPGISGAELIHVTHWLGALISVMDIIGIKQTPVREMIHTAANYVSTPIKLISLVVVKDGLAGMFFGDVISAWDAAAELSSMRHIQWLDAPIEHVLSCAPVMYDELWTAAKAMYKLEPVIADGGQITVYAPHLDTVSHVHGDYIYEVGYHVRDYFLKQWEQYKHIPLGVLAHSTHFRGNGKFENGIEYPRVKLSLASKISPDDCDHLALGYVDPNNIDLNEWERNSDSSRLYIPKAGEVLYRLRSQR